MIDKYREWALKSGFPFENEILILINKHMPLSKVTRNIEFTTPNEDGKPTIRSVDFAVSISKNLRNIPHRDWSRGRDEVARAHFIIDCKYTTEESFLFTPSTRPIPISERNWTYLVPALLKDSFGMDCLVHRRDLIGLAKVNENCRVAGTGRKVKEQSRERDSVASALLQVLQGTQHFVENSSQSLGAVSKADSAYERNAYFFIPIIVTNAPLVLLKEGLTGDDVQKSKNKEEIFLDLDSILVEMPDIYDLKASWGQLKSVLGKSRKPNLGWVEKGIEDGHVLFCNPKGLENFLSEFASEFNKLTMDGT